MKIFLLALGLTALSGAAGYFLNKDAPPEIDEVKAAARLSAPAKPRPATIPESTASAENDSAVNEPTVVEPARTRISEANSKPAAPADDFSLDPLLMSALEDYENSRGHFSNAAQLQYETYQSDVLEQLSIEGDLLATQTLAARKEAAGSMKEAYGLYITAAAQGSTYAISRISAVWHVEQQYAVYDKDIERAARARIEYFTWKEVLKLRNEVGTDAHDRGDANLGFEPSPGEQDTAEKQARHYYQMLEQRRRELGYGSFDNTIPKEVLQAYEAFDRRWQQQNQ